MFLVLKLPHYYHLETSLITESKLRVNGMADLQEHFAEGINRMCYLTLTGCHPLDGRSKSRKHFGQHSLSCATKLRTSSSEKSREKNLKFMAF